MFKKLLTRLVGRHYRKFQKSCRPIIARINALEAEMQSWPEDKIKNQTNVFKQRHQQGETLDKLLPEAFATVKNAARRLVGTQREVCGHIRTWDMVPFDVQLLGGIALHRGYIAEMATGEGKTLVATLPLYLNALTGKNCQLVTVNDYLARRDSEWMGHLFNYLGLTVGCIQNDMRLRDRQAAYRADITYGTASEFGFDYLRDNGMASRLEDQVQNGHYFCIVDEVDSVLIDEARTPLIISGEAETDDSGALYMQLRSSVQHLYDLQTRLCVQLLEQARPLLKAGEKPAVLEQGLEKLYQLKLANPKNRALLHILEDGRICRAFNKFETQLSAEYNRKRAYDLKEALYFTIEERAQQADLTEKGRNALSPNDPDAFTLLDLPTIFSEIDGNPQWSAGQKLEKRQAAEKLFNQRSLSIHCITQLLRAFTLYQRDVHYMISEEDGVVIIDENTGRAMRGRRWSDGLHQAVEAKEGLHPKRESKTYATITMQNYFRMYQKLAGMTGTAETEAQEFFEIYRLKVMVIPPNRPCMRIDENDVIFKTRRAKYKAVIQDIEAAHEKGQPVLVGTASVEISELLSRLLKGLKIPHAVLNAKHHQQEAEIVARAGEWNAVTIATNMAGRGTDIKLGDGVEKVGGLLVLGTERHESRRIDRQLRGRCARQGDPGRSKFFISLEDPLMRIFATSGRIGAFLERNMDEDEALVHPFLNHSIQTAQKKVEQRNYSIRKRLLQYDDVLNRQRAYVYDLRNEILQADPPIDLALKLIDEELEQRVSGLDDQAGTRHEMLTTFVQWLNVQFPLGLKVEELEQKPTKQIVPEIMERLRALFVEKATVEGDDCANQAARFVLLHAVDKNWQEQLTELDDLRQSVGLRGYGQRDPLIEYKNEAYACFARMISQMSQDICFRLFRLSLRVKPQETAYESDSESTAEDSADEEPAIVLPKPSKIAVVQPEAGRNDLCPCGSGKKYKKCCGSKDGIIAKRDGISPMHHYSKTEIPS